MAITGVAAIREDCEICSAPLRPRALRGGGALARCERCGHLLRDLRDSPAAHRDLAYGGEPTLDRIRLDLTYRAMLRAVPGDAPRSVFEVGYGSGSMLRRFLDGGATIAGADPDQLRIGVDPLVVAQGRLSAGSVEDVLRDGADPVDLVYGIHVLEHVLDPVATLAVAFDLARPGGVVQFLTPAGDSDGVRLYGSAWWMLEDPTHVRFFTADSLARAATDAGFVDVVVRRPVLDSLTTDAASAVRRWRPAPRPRGVLASRSVIAAGLASAPLVLAARAVRPTMRPTLHLIARRPR
ncbi:methyltransferase domain-containing protein [Allobranchiibius sp. GilTou73]|uniref:methyltransferase domain-containing protein n=1 Tax=Allobranchiibius sp. GilTou73 TaxID=2904523 RepID=UPI001F38C077|nr:methyltransferase domain-containing protein [Allobranchiibius sp. GilTou73]UIJ33829.1 methyltransferase domain-containing protein [Allobranchiibius sp. GilTou73]